MRESGNWSFKKALQRPHIRAEAPNIAVYAALTHSNLLVGKRLNIDASAHRLKQRPEALDSHQEPSANSLRETQAAAGLWSKEPLRSPGLCLGSAQRDRLNFASCCHVSLQQLHIIAACQ